ncbi:MAG: hypothetical protein AAF035_04915, partial [Pseudomonadota bacterium]
RFSGLEMQPMLAFLLGAKELNIQSAANEELSFFENYIQHESLLKYQNVSSITDIPIRSMEEFQKRIVERFKSMSSSLVIELCENLLSPDVTKQKFSVGADFGISASADYEVEWVREKTCERYKQWKVTENEAAE